MKYLGIIINDSKKCFKEHKKNIIEKARKLANMTCPVINKSCSRILIGKTFWKSIALPIILYGINIMDLTKQEIETLQRIENSVYRMILRASNYTQTAALRGEIGATSMKARILKGQWKYFNYCVKEESNDLLRRKMEVTKEQNTNRWMKELVQTLKKTGMTESGMVNITNDEIIKKIKDWDTKEWKTILSEKESLSIYRNGKTEIGNQEQIYNNRQCSV